LIHRERASKYLTSFRAAIQNENVVFRFINSSAGFM
jgi:hypothetical protein